MLEFNVTVSFPAAPLLTVILALVGKLFLHLFIGLILNNYKLKGMTRALPITTLCVYQMQRLQFLTGLFTTLSATRSKQPAKGKDIANYNILSTYLRPNNGSVNF